MTNDDVHSALVRWLAATLNRTVIKAHQGAKAPALPYIMVNMLGSIEVREHEQRTEYVEAGGDVTAAPVIETEWRFSVHAYGSHPTDILRPIVSAARLPQVTEPLMPNLILFDLSQIRNVPDWINDAWQPRAQMDINLRGLTRDGIVIDVIEHTQFEFERRA